jgi:hypothetical protein
MKKLISIWFLFFFIAIGNAQENKKSKWSELNQDQLKIALKKSSRTVKIGKILTFSGAGIETIAWGLAWSEQGKAGPNYHNKMVIADYALYAGVITLYTGIPLWIVGSIKKKIITFELVKFNPTGSTSINGIGLKIRF